MAQTNSIAAPTAIAPTWRRVVELADLVEIFDPDVQVCSWQREPDPAIATYLSGLQQFADLQVIETVSADNQPKLERLPNEANPESGRESGRQALVEDISLLQEVLCELLGCDAVGLRLARVGHAMCPGWHIDRVGIRVVCTYQGPGTQWLDDQDVDRHKLKSDQIRIASFAQASPGEIVLLKGALWQGNETFGAVHRSPELTTTMERRTLVTLDPLWRE